MLFGSIYVNNKAVVYGRFIKQIQEFKKKTGVDEIRLTEDKKKGKEDFLTCGAFGKTECVVAALDLMKNEAGCRKSLIGIVLFNWNDRNVNIVIFQSRSPTLPPSLKDELEAKVEKISTGAKIKELEDLIVKNKKNE